MSRRTPPALRILSLGAGLDSTTVLLMSEHGEVERLDAAIFADTMAEPQGVYDTLEWLTHHVTIPIYRITGGDLVQVVLGGMSRNERIGTPPLYVPGLGRDRKGSILYRECTRYFKINPIRAKLRELLGIAPRGGIPKGLYVEQWIGFTMEDLGRTFCSERQWIVNRFPLIEKRLRKHDCRAWLTTHGYPIPPKSSCVFCPYHRNEYWRDMRDNRPAEWQQAVAFEAALHQGKLPGVRGIPYVHKSMVPLPMAPIDEPETGQEELFCFACNT